MSAENAWLVARAAFLASEERDTFDDLAFHIANCPMPPAFRAEVEAEELREALRMALAALDSTEALLPPWQRCTDFMPMVREDAKIRRLSEARVLLSRLEAKGESHE